MNALDEAVREFLALKRIAVVGVSRAGDQPANLVFRKLAATGHQVFPVNPNADRVEGSTCYPDVGSIPGGVDGAVVVTTPEVALAVVENCAAAGVGSLWFHRSFGGGSVSQKAVERCRELGVRAIPGACPMMYCEPIDLGHKCMRWLAGATGRLPQPVRPGAAR